MSMTSRSEQFYRVRAAILHRGRSFTSGHYQCVTYWDSQVWLHDDCNHPPHALLLLALSKIVIWSVTSVSCSECAGYFAVQCTHWGSRVSIAFLRRKQLLLGTLAFRTRAVPAFIPPCTFYPLFFSHCTALDSIALDSRCISPLHCNLQMLCAGSLIFVTRSVIPGCITHRLCTAYTL